MDVLLLRFPFWSAGDKKNLCDSGSCIRERRDWKITTERLVLRRYSAEGFPLAHTLAFFVIELPVLAVSHGQANSVLHDCLLLAQTSPGSLRSSYGEYRGRTRTEIPWGLHAENRDRAPWGLSFQARGLRISSAHRICNERKRSRIPHVVRRVICTFTATYLFRSCRRRSSSLVSRFMENSKHSLGNPYRFTLKKTVATNFLHEAPERTTWLSIFDRSCSMEAADIISALYKR